MASIGQDIITTVFRDDAPQLVFTSQRSVTFTPGLSHRERRHLGKKTATLVGTNESPTLALPFEPGSPEWVQLLAIQRQKNEGDPVALRTIINVSFLVTFEDKTKSKVLMANCVITSGTTQVGGQQEDLTADPVFVAPTWTRLA